MKKGEILAYVHSNSSKKADECVKSILEAYKIGSKKNTKKNIIEII